MLKKMLDQLKPHPKFGDELSYEEARDALERASDAKNQALARREDAPPEVLYYLAEAGKPAVRTLVAENPTTPHKANLILVDDPDDEVRCALARKIARLLPDLPSDEQVRLRESALEVLERLAADHLPKVRRILVEALKASDAIPYKTVVQLAHDADTLVSVPIIEYSPLLRDEDLLEIIATSTVTDVLQAVARRQNVREPVADAVVASLDIPAVAALLANPSAQIREQTLDTILDHAESIEPWHAPLVMRAELSLRAIRRIAGFVGSSLLDKLCEIHPLDEETQKEIRARMRSRIEHEDSWSEAENEAELAAQEARAAYDAGHIDDAFIEDAVLSGKRGLCIEALALTAALPARTVKRILASRNAKSVTALAWKAGLSMRTAVQMETHLAHVPHQALIFAKDGLDYPLADDEMKWHIGYFTANQE